jgi:hypothetical protein
MNAIEHLMSVVPVEFDLLRLYRPRCRRIYSAGGGADEVRE